MFSFQMDTSSFRYARIRRLVKPFTLGKTDHSALHDEFSNAGRCSLEYLCEDSVHKSLL